MKNLWYFPLEPVASRYTSQLCEEWMPAAFAKHAGHLKLRVVPGVAAGDDIQVGAVLDATGRGIYAASQVVQFLSFIRGGEVKDGDVLFFQDFWTPGIEAIPYALHLHGIETRQYAMNHAQSVDEFDFTHPMRGWMRPFELGIDAWLSGQFVASSVHREQLRAAGFKSPIHVVGLPIDAAAVRRMGPADIEKRKAVVYSSRLDLEKQPSFMLKIALDFLAAHPDWEWWITTSAKLVRSNDPGLPALLATAQRVQPRLKVFTGLTKAAYYERLAAADIQFNSSLQDYVSWTLLEAAIFHCKLVYPNFRSFPECIPTIAKYTQFDAADALRLLDLATTGPRQATTVVEACDAGRMIEAAIIGGAPTLGDFTIDFRHPSIHAVR